MKAWQRLLLRLLSAGTVIAATVGVVARVGGSAGEVLGFASLRAHALVLGLLTLDLTCRGLRMSLLAGQLGHSVPLGTAVFAQLGGEGAAALTPARAGSDAGRMLVLRRAGVRLSQGGAIVVAEMVFEVVALLLVTGVLVLLVPFTRRALPGVLLYAGVVLTTTLGAPTLARAVLRRPDRFPRLRPRLERWGLFASLHGFQEACSVLRRAPLITYGLLLLLSAAHIAARLSILPALLSDQLAAGEFGPALGWPLLLLYAGALVPVPGGGGALELAFAAVLGRTLGPATGAALVWWRVYTFHLLAATGGCVLLRAAAPPRCQQVTTAITRRYESP